MTRSVLSLDEAPEAVDLLIVGSGPVGSAFARVVRMYAPDAHILMVDAGPVISASPGEHLANARSVTHATRPVFDTGQHAAEGPASSPTIRPRPGTRLVFASNSDLPAYADAINVGGMGVYWTCATPRPDCSERERYICDPEWANIVSVAEQLLGVKANAWPMNTVTQSILNCLRTEYANLPENRPVAMMPTALQWIDGVPQRSCPNLILGDMLTEPPTSFALVPSAMCTRLRTKSGRAIGADLRDPRDRHARFVATSAVVVAAGAIRTPQLLWASGIRPPALGRFIGEHFQMLASVAWPGRVPAPWDDDRTAAMIWIPYCDSHPYHGQVMLFDQRPSDSAADEDASVVGLSWLIPPTIKEENRVEFSESDTDWTGMPKPSVVYPVSDEDRRRIAGAAADQDRAMRALGYRVLPGGAPRLLPRGASLHITGTVRAGSSDDGTTVCDQYGRVWGTDNVFVGGNGVIAASTSSNPTLISVALAVRAAPAVARCIGTRPTPPRP